MRLKLLVLVCFCCTGLLAQDIATSPRLAAGLSYGFGKEAENSDYTYSNRYIQAQLYYSFNPGKQWEYLAALQPEVNFARHQLLNLYFVKPDEPGYERKREEFTKLKEVREYIINVAFFVRRNLTKNFNVYAMANVGPMITDTETERLSKGFAFCDVFALGASYNTGSVVIDVRPNIRHVSNGGLQDSNSGINTLNIAFGLVVPLK